MNRNKGPKGIKLQEIIHQLFKYEVKLNWKWQENKSEIIDFILNTLKLLRRDEPSIVTLFNLPKGKCEKCRSELTQKAKYFHEIKSEDISKNKKRLSMKDIVMQIF